MIDGCLAWQGDGITLPDVVRAATNDYFEEQDLFGQWIGQFVERTGLRTRSAELRASWDYFAQALGQRWTGDARWFTDQMKTRGFRKVKMDNGKQAFECSLKKHGGDSPGGTGGMPSKRPVAQGPGRGGHVCRLTPYARARAYGLIGCDAAHPPVCPRPIFETRLLPAPANTFKRWPNGQHEHEQSASTSRASRGGTIRLRRGSARRRTCARPLEEGLLSPEGEDDHEKIQDALSRAVSAWIQKSEERRWFDHEETLYNEFITSDWRRR